MIFVDASAIVAILADEAEHVAACYQALETEDYLVSSPIALWETSMALRRKAADTGRALTMSECLAVINQFLFAKRFSVVSVNVGDWTLAGWAAENYGKGTGHPARLNMADCFHYAVAKRLDASILFTSPEEFYHTDLISVLSKPA